MARKVRGVEDLEELSSSVDRHYDGMRWPLTKKSSTLSVILGSAWCGDLVRVGIFSIYTLADIVISGYIRLVMSYYVYICILNLHS